MATDSPFFLNETGFGDYEEPHYVDKTAQVGCWIAFIIMTLILNAVVIAGIFLLYSKKPSTKFGSPKLFVVLVCCVVQIVDALVPSSMGVHINRIDRNELESALSCGALVFLELSSFLLSTVVTLLIAVVVVLEGLKRQQFVNLGAKTQTVAALLLLALTAMYALVVVTPTFFLLWLQDGARPCSEEYFGLNINADYYQVRVIHVVSYVVPHCGVLAAFLLLLVVSLTRRRRHGVFPPHVLYYPASVQADSPGASHDPPGSSLVDATGDVTPNTHPEVSNPTNDVSSSSPKVDDTTASPPSTGAPAVRIAAPPTPFPQPPTSPPSQPCGADPLEEAGGFPWYTLLAAAVSLVLGFLFFFSQFQQLSLSPADVRRLWAAGVLLTVLRGVFLPCCWLVDRDLRSAWTCCGAGHADPDRSQQEAAVRL